MTPGYVQVQVGDEVHWINQRSTPMRLQFLGDALEAAVRRVGYSNRLRRQQEGDPPGSFKLA